MKKSKIVLLFSILILFIIFVIRFKLESNYKLTYDKEVYGTVIQCLDNSKMVVRGKEKVIISYKKSFNCKLGEKICAYGEYSLPDNNRVFNLFNYRNYLLGKGIKYIFKAHDLNIISNKISLKYKIKSGLYSYLDKFKSKDYLYSFILGDTSNIDKLTMESYRNNGISHLFSISGAHITVFTFLLFMVLNTVFKRDYSFLIVCTFLLFYLFITDYSPSIVRSAVLFITLNFTKLFGIKVKPLYVIFFSCLILLVINPFNIYNLGFTLSYTISFFITLSSSIINRYGNYFFKSLIISFVCFFSSYPLIVNTFFEVNFLSPLLSTVFSPFICFLIYPICLLSLVFKPFDYLIYNFMHLFNGLSLLFSKVDLFNMSFSHLNYFYFILYYVLLIIVILKKKGWCILIVFMVVHLNVNYIFSDVRITTLDVGQGDSILIKAGRDSILIDTGGDINYDERKIAINTTIPYLKSLGINKLNYLILSHGDYDHMGEAINLVNNFKVEKVIFNCGRYNDLEKELIKVLDKKKIKYYSCIKKLNIDSNKLYFLQTREYDNENDNSNVIYTELSGYNFMFMGDAGIEKEKDILNKYNISDIDVLKVGHHGSKTSSDKEFIDEINPKYSIISVSKNNRYGHPNKEVLNTLQGSKIYRTDQDGSIMFKIKNNKLKIETCSP